MRTVKYRTVDGASEAITCAVMPPGSKLHSYSAAPIRTELIFSRHTQGRFIERSKRR